MTFLMEHMASGILFAYTMLIQGRYEESRILVEGFLTIDPDNPYLHSMLASSYARQDRLDEAVASYSRAIELFTEDINSLANRGEIYLKQGRSQLAAADLRKTLELDVQKNHPAANRARLLMQMTSVALRLADEQGIEAVNRAREQFEAPLKK